MTRLSDMIKSFDELERVPASFRYIADSSRFATEQPYFYQGPLDPECEHLRTNVEFEAHHDVPVHDLRPKASLLELEKHGVQLLHHPSSFADDLLDSEKLNSYLVECNNLLRAELKAELVVCYDVKFRRSRREPAKIVYYDKSYLGSVYAPDEPAWQAHADSTVAGGKLRVTRHLSDKEIAKYMNERWRVRIINLWRPLHHVVEESPLAFCDRDSLAATDLVDVERPSENRIGHVAFLKYNPVQQWYWISKQAPEEVLMFIGWDSAALDARSFLTHAAFQIPEGHTCQNLRESVETRAIVITANHGMEGAG